MKKILSLVLMFAMAVPLSLVPSVAVAAGDYAVNINEPIAISGQTVTLTGNASTTNYVGQPSQQHVSVWWTSASLSGSAGNDIVIPTGSFSGNGFNYNWSFNHTYTPGTYTITVKVCHQSCTGAEGSGDSIDTSIVVIPPANTAPVAHAKSLTTNEDTATSTVLVATDSDIPAQTLTYSIVGNPSFGLLSGFNPSTGAVIYTPNANYNGSDSFTFKANDGTVDSNTATVSINVVATNDAPTSAPSSATIAEDTSLVASLSANDIDGNSLVYATTTNPTNGTLTLNSANGQYTYTPNLNFNGSDSFMFKVNDGTTDSNVSTVSITVTPVNDAPVLTLGTTTAVTIDELTNFSFTSSATDADGNTLSYSLSGAPAGASINSSTGVFTWTPTEAQGPGVYPFSVVVSDGSLTDSESITVTVNEVNVAPVTTGISVSTHQNVDKNINLAALSSDSDIPANTLTYVLVSGPTNGTLATFNTSTGAVTYSPAANWTGSDSFTYKANDGTTDSNVSTVTITVDDGAPVLGFISNFTIPEMAAFNFTATATDPDSDPFTFAITSLVSGFTFDTNTGLFSWTPTEIDGPGVYNFNVTVNAGAQSDAQAFTITVTEVNIDPVAINLSVITDEDMATSSVVTATDSDLPANTLTYATTSTPTNGTVTAFDSSTGAFTYMPNVNYFGSDSFTFKANDGTADSNIATVSITVNSVNDAPVVTLIGSSTINMVATTTSFVDPGATGNDTEDGPLTPVVTGTVDTNTPGTYTLIYTVTDSDDATASTTRTVIITAQPVENTQSLCTDGIDNDGDQLIDLADPDCAQFIPPTVDVCSNIAGNQSSVPSDHTELGGVCTPKSNGGGGGGNGPINFGFVNGGSVLGASTGEVLGESCGLYMDKHIRLGSSKNNAEQVRKLQTFLNKNMGSQLPITGFYGPLTYGVVKNFQVKYNDEVMKPWGLTAPTGLVYLATLRQINNLECPELSLELPPLIPWSKNPNAQ